MAIGGIVFGTAPELSKNNNYDNDYYYDKQFRHQLAGAMLMGFGGAAVIAGGVLDIIWSNDENKLQAKLESEGVSLSIAPDFTSDSLQLAVKYSF